MLALVKSLSYTPDASFSQEFLLHSWCYVLVRNFSYTPDVSFSEEVLLHSRWQF